MSFNSNEFIKYAQQYSVPEYVRTATTSVFTELDDPKNKAACFLSKFAALCGDRNISERERYKRAEILNIGDDLEELERNFEDYKRPKTVKKAAPKEKYPLRNENEVKVAAHWLSKNAITLPTQERRELGSRILKQASQYELEMPDYIEKVAGVGYPDLEILVDNIEKRAELVVHEKLHTPMKRRKTAQDLRELAQIVKMQPKTSREDASLDKIATTLQFIDNEYGLHGHYGHCIDDPDCAVRPHSQKTAQEIEKYACELNGAIYDRRDFEQVKIADILETMGPDYVTAMSSGLQIDGEKVAEALEVMNELEKTLFSDILKEAAVVPQYVIPRTVSIASLNSLLRQL